MQPQFVVWGGELVWSSFPDSKRYCSEVPAWRESWSCHTPWMGWLDHRDDVLAMFARLGVPVVDGHAAFVDTGQAPADFFYSLGSHYSPAGYQVIAEAGVADTSGSPRRVRNHIIRTASVKSSPVIRKKKKIAN